MTACNRCSSGVCDGRTVSCLGCGTEQCHMNGLARGSCSVCHFGILPGWSGWRQTCGYKGCDKPAAFHHVPGSVKTVCHDCAATRERIWTRDRVQTQPKITLAEYVRIAKLPNGRGVVRAGEVTVPRCLFLSESDERMVDAQIARARAIGGAS